MPRSYKEEYEHWLNSPALSEAEWEELNAIRDDEKEIESRFYAPLEFGTAGLRGTMKLGLHHMNIHVIRHATQAFANVIAAEGEEAKRRGIVIDHDCRLNGVLFAREAACVMAANGIHVRLFDSLHPTPELSFAVRHYGATAGLNITASHNPKEYNGYKVYWSDGAQLPPQKADAIAKQMEAIDIFNGFKTCEFDKALAEGKIEMIGDETDEAYLQCVLGQAIDREAVRAVADDFKIVYTPFHGCGYKLVPEHRVKPVHDSAMSGYKLRVIFKSFVTLDPGCNQIPQHSYKSAYHTDGSEYKIKILNLDSHLRKTGHNVEVSINTSDNPACKDSSDTSGQ